MAYISQLDGLKPYSVNSYVGIKSVSYRHPFTPFWWRPGTSSVKRGIELDGKVFHAQNSFVYPDDSDWPDDRTLVCGSLSYRQKVSNYTWEGASCTAYASGQETVLRYYDFATSAAALTEIAYDPPLGVGPPFYGLPGVTSPTPRTQTFGSLRAGPRVVDSCSLTVFDSQLSGPVDAEWLIGVIEDWDGSTHISNNTSYSFHTESTQGWRCRVAFMEVRPHGYWFSGTPFGMTGDLGSLWNGNYSAYVIKEIRKNQPRVWKTAQLKPGAFPEDPDRMLPQGPDQGYDYVIGAQIYKEGYFEEELSEECTGQFVDAYGVFSFGEEGSWDGPLSGAPYRPIYLGGVPASDGYKLTSYVGGEEDGRCNELMLVSTSGKRYRVTFQIAEYDGWSGADELVMEADEHTLRATHRFGIEAQYKQVRVSLIEVWGKNVEGDPDWVVLADIAEWDDWNALEQGYYDDYYAWLEAWDEWYYGGEIGPEPIEPEYNVPAMPDSPGALISHDPRYSKHLVSVFKFRAGSAYGFYPLDYTYDRRFAKRTYRKHLIPGTLTTANTGCGGDTLTGGIDLEYYESYVDGELRSPVVTQWQCTLNGVDWTPSDYTDYSSLPSFGHTTRTATLRRFETAGPDVVKWDHLLEVAFDWPDPRGKLISTSTQLVPMVVSGSTNVAPDFVPVAVPDPGYTAIYPGHRLVPSPVP
jgi:hypothetical protein